MPHRKNATALGTHVENRRTNACCRKASAKIRFKNQIDGSRADDDSEPSTHRVANAIPIIPNVSTMASWQSTAGSCRGVRPDDWKTVSQNLSENRSNPVSVLLSINFPQRIQIMPAIIEFLSRRPALRPLTVTTETGDWRLRSSPAPINRVPAHFSGQCRPVRPS